MSACLVCSRPIAAGSRSDRRTCSHACRMSLSRGRRPESLWAPVSVTAAADVSSDPSRPSAPASAARARSMAEVAAGIPTPVDPHFGPCRAYVDVRPDLRYGIHFAIDGGRVRQLVAEPTFRGPRDAMRLADLINGRLAG